MAHVGAYVVLKFIRMRLEGTTDCSPQDQNPADEAGALSRQFMR